MKITVCTPNKIRCPPHGPAGLTHSWTTEEALLRPPLSLPHPQQRPSSAAQRSFNSQLPLSCTTLAGKETSLGTSAELSPHLQTQTLTRHSDVSVPVLYQLPVIKVCNDVNVLRVRTTHRRVISFTAHLPLCLPSAPFPLFSSYVVFPPDFLPYIPFHLCLY